MSGSPAGLEGALRVCRALEALGVTHVFGLPGTQLVPFFEGLRRSRLTTVVPMHELAAAFMAGAYFRASGRPAALLTIPGPGFAYALAGLAEARLDSAALIHVTIAEPDGPRARFRLQAIPQRTLGNALAKATLTVSRVGDVDAAIERAHALALSGEPGPVIVALAERASDSPVEVSTVDAARRPIAALSLEATWRRLQEAERPLLFAGQGAAAVAQRVQRLAERIGAPVLTTPSARGVVPEDHPLLIPFDSNRGGVPVARALLERADLVLVLGAKLGHNGTAGGAFAFDPARTVQVDADGTVCGQAQDIPGVVSRLEDWFDAEPSVGWRASAWDATALEETRVAIRSAAGQGPEPLIAGQSAEAFFAALRRALPRDGILVTDTGVHQVLARRHYDVLVPRGLIVPTDLQSMGFGLPAAIAARLAAPDRPVVGLVGDGSLLMNGFELATAAHLGLCLPVVVFVDGYLNQIRLHQQSDYGHDWGTTLPSLEIAAIADATGAAFADGSAIEPALADALRRPGPTLIAVPVGDSPAIEWRRRTRRAKEAVRGLVGAWLLDRIRGRRAP